MSLDPENPKVESAFSTIEALLESGHLVEARDQLEVLALESRCRIECQELEARLLWKEQRLAELETLLDSIRPKTGEPRQVWFVEMHSAQLAARRGQPRLALERITKFLALHETELLPQQRAQGHAWMANAWVELRCMDAARLEFDRALRIYEMLNDLNGVARMMNSLGGCERFEGRWDKAIAMYEHAIRCFEKVGDPRGIGVACGRLGALRLFRGHFNSAASNLRRALLLGYETGDFNVPVYQAAIGLLYVRTGSPSARSHLAHLYRANRRSHFPRAQVMTCEYLGELALWEGRWKTASRWFQQAIQIAQPVGFRDAVGESMCRLAEVDLALRDAESALARVDKCLVDFESMGDVYEVAVCRRVRGQSLLALGRIPEARAVLTSALEFFQSVDERFESRRIAMLLGAASRGEVIWDIRAATHDVTDHEPRSRAGRAHTHAPASNVNPTFSGARSVETSTLAASEGLLGFATTKCTHHPDFPRILGLSPALLETLDLVKRSAPSSSPVLIEGETGTGKELLARAIHELSPRSSRPFIPFNCGTSTPEVFDAEICGHVRGAFTGAHGARAGLARAADGGTLFLDEIAELNESIQPRLLRLLDIGEIRPVGSDEVLQADVRVVAATHQDMDVAVESKRFRADLFYRLCTFRIRVPALRERLDDLPILVEHFVEEARRNGYPEFAGVSTTVIGKMARHDWPGNLRELRNEVIRLAQRSNPGEKARRWTAPEHQTSVPLIGSDGPKDWERDRLLTELRLARGSVATAARKLGISRARVYRLLKYWEIDLNTFRS